MQGFSFSVKCKKQPFSASFHVLIRGCFVALKKDRDLGFNSLFFNVLRVGVLPTKYYICRPKTKKTMEKRNTSMQVTCPKITLQFWQCGQK
ncbi:MAG: hypothetical protein SNH63_03450 [Rikenellaceae bacterium]